MTTRERAQSAFSSLPAKQREVLVLVAKGLNINEIGERLYRSPHTIKTYKEKAYRALGINKSTQAAVICALAGAVTEWEG